MTEEPRLDAPSRFVASLLGGRELEWLKMSLGDLGAVVPAESDQLDEVLGLLDLGDARVMFVGVTAGDLNRASALIEGITAARPMLTVIAVGDGNARDELLAAMRAGARDFLAVGTRASEVRALVRRALDRVPVQQDDRDDRGVVWAVMNARPDLSNAFIASHLAVGLRHEKPSSRVLLLDLGVPSGDCLTLLGLESSFTFFDAMRNLRRLDQTLLESALPSDGSGVHVLSIPEDGDGEEEVSTAELYLLLGTLKRHYSHVVVNLGGLPQGAFLHVMLNNADEVLQLVDQSVPSFRQNVKRLDQMRTAGTQIRSLRVVVDRVQSRLAPDADTVAERIGAPLLVTLPGNGLQRMRAINLGKSLFEMAPRDSLVAGIRTLIRRLDAHQGDRPGGFREWLRGMTRRNG
ncbi:MULTISPECIES: hypothetical protein [unclassified Thioalkalivibrio]|uniref:AAA family ATPase n=1 Tax=unclassified Thioalkalivibrio TaxID=2621013 RepID=UPI000378F4DD|nr:MULTISPECIES: hypothetical protein [unclassified Thioalkalivibrio]